MIWKLQVLAYSSTACRASMQEEFQHKRLDFVASQPGIFERLWLWWHEFFVSQRRLVAIQYTSQLTLQLVKVGGDFVFQIG